MTHSCCSSEVVPVLVLEQRQLDHGGIVVLCGGLWKKKNWDVLPTTISMFKTASSF